MLTLGGITVASLIGGALLIEVTFSWPGVALRLQQAISQRDYPVVQGVVAVTVVVDVLVAWIDLSLKEVEELRSIAGSRTLPHGKVRRGQIVLGCAEVPRVDCQATGVKSCHGWQMAPSLSGPWPCRTPRPTATWTASQL